MGEGGGRDLVDAGGWVVGSRRVFLCLFILILAVVLYGLDSSVSIEA